MFTRLRTVLLVATIAVQARAAEVQTLSGKTYKGDLKSLAADKVVIKTEAGDEAIPTADLLSIDLSASTGPREAYSEVELSDGSVLACTAFAFKGDQAELTLVGGLAVKAPLAAVATVLKDAHDPATKHEWVQLLRKRGQYDMLVVRTEGKLDSLDGTFGVGTPAGDAIEFALASSDQKITPKLSRVQGIVFVRKPDPNAPPAYCKVVDQVGNVFVAKEVNLDGEAVKLTTVSGGAASYNSIKKLARLDFSKGKLTYLSDLEPIEKEHSSTEVLVFPYRRDHNIFGGELRLREKPYAKGLALHSRTALVYDIGGDYKEFRCVLGVDEAVRTESGPPVRLLVTIEGDGRELFKGEVKSKDEPRAIAVDVQRVRRLRIVASASNFDTGQQVDLCDARVSK